MEKEYDIIIGPEQGKERIDTFLSRSTGLSRSQVEKLISSGSVQVNHQATKSGYRVKKDDRIIIRVPEPKELSAKPQNIPLDIIYEDKDIIVVNKSRGIVVHPAAGNREGTLVNALLYHCRDLSGIGGCVRPGVVHRLDKDTSGLIVFAKNDQAHLNLSSQIKERRVKKTYLALVYGDMKKDEGTINEPLGRNPVNRKKISVIRSSALKRRDAVTSYRVLKRYKGYTLVELDLKTGRTHQIRVHMSYIGHPIVGDNVYSRRTDEFGVKGQLLHASKLEFDHPVTGKHLEFKAELPEDFAKVQDRVSRG